MMISEQIQDTLTVVSLLIVLWNLKLPVRLMAEWPTLIVGIFLTVSGVVEIGQIWGYYQ